MKGMPGGGGLQQMMKQANQLQIKMNKLKEELAQREYTGTASGGAVTAVIKGEDKFIDLRIQNDVMQAGDVEMLQDLVKIACNEALKKAKDEAGQEMSKLTGGFSLL